MKQAYLPEYQIFELQHKSALSFKFTLYTAPVYFFFVSLQTAKNEGI